MAAGGGRLSVAQIARLHARQDAANLAKLGFVGASQLANQRQLVARARSGQLNTQQIEPRTPNPKGTTNVVDTAGNVVAKYGPGGKLLGGQKINLLDYAQKQLGPHTIQIKAQAPDTAQIVSKIPGVGPFVSQTAQGIGQSFVDLPSGVYSAAAAPVSDLSHGRYTLPQTRRFAKNVAVGQYDAVFKQHDPSAIVLSALGGASLLGRLGEAAKAGMAARAAGDSALGAAAKNLVHRPPGGMREIHFGKQSTLALNSENPVARLAQRGVDRMLGIDKPGGHSSGLTNLATTPAAQRFYSRQARLNRVVEQTREAQFGPPEPKAPEPKDVTPASAVAGGLGRGAGQLLRMGNRVSRLTVLGGKLGYFPTNLLGQEFLAAAHDPLGFLASRVRQGRALKTLGDKGNARLNALADAGFGMIGSTKPEYSAAIPGVNAVERGVDYLDRGFSRVSGRVLDQPYRRAAIVKELRRQGFKTQDAVNRATQLLAQHGENVRGGAIPKGTLPTGTAAKAAEAGLRSRQAMIDYELGKTGKSVRNAIFFAPWLKGSTLYAGHFLRDHPALAAAAQALGREGQKERGLGPNIPSFMRIAGDFKVGERNVPGLGRVPVMANPSSAGILGQSAQLGATAASMLGIIPTKSGWDPEGNLVPMLSSALAAVTHKDPFTGKNLPGSWPSIFGNQYLNSIPAYTDFYKGGVTNKLLGVGPKAASENPTRVLFPRTPGDRAWQFALGGLGQTPVNPVEARSRYRAEETGATDRAGAAKLRANWLRQDILDALNRNLKGQGKPTLSQVPGALNQGIGYQLSSALQALRVKQQHPELVTSHGVLNATGGAVARVAALLASRGASQAKIDSVTAKLAKLPPAAIAQLEIPTPDSLTLLRQFVKAANSSDAQRYPYANGGAPISLPSRVR